MGTEPSVIDSHCNKCGPKINHKVCSRYKREWKYVAAKGTEWEYDIDGGSEYLILECAGCGEVHTRIDSWNSEAQDPDTGEFYVSEEYSPPRVFRKKPEWMEGNEYKHKCIPSIYNLMDEAYKTMQNETPHSTAMAIRATLEQLMIHVSEKDQGSFGKNLKGLQNKGYLSRISFDHLKTVLDVGHAAIHRGYSPKPEDLVLCFDITEQVLQTVFLHQEQIVKTQSNIPARPVVAPPQPQKNKQSNGKKIFFLFRWFKVLFTRSN